FLKNGTISSVSAGVCALKYKISAAANAPPDCQKYFHRAGKPRGSFSTTMRQSSTQPTAPKSNNTPVVIHTKRLLKSAHSKVESTMATIIKPPPIVGVPDFFKWLSG